MVFPDFPLEMIATKVELATNYLNVLNIIDPGLSKFRAKWMFELVDTKLYIFSRGFQETGEANIKELEGNVPNISQPSNFNETISRFRRPFG